MAEQTTRHGPARLGPLAALALPAGSGDTVTLAATGWRARVNLRCDADRAASVPAVTDALGVSLPQTPNTWTGDDQLAAVWLGPDEWLITGEDGRGADLEQALRNALHDDPRASACDVSHNYTGLLLAGPAARTVLAKGCPLDLHRAGFRPGHAAQSVLAGTRVLLLCGGDEDSFELLVRNSFARYAAAWLQDAMAEFNR
ncbi:MAG: sarcosine oxidase subunit gamma family protein [Woeseiaceae bacterium]|nr:sarcosine oxidase subunit gamma family protein [Woeseiaceae bacterium]